MDEGVLSSVVPPTPRAVRAKTAAAIATKVDTTNMPKIQDQFQACCVCGFVVVDEKMDRMADTTEYDEEEVVEDASVVVSSSSGMVRVDSFCVSFRFL